MNQKPAHPPLPNLLQTTDAPYRVEQTADSFPEAVFRSPAIKETIGNTTFVVLIIAFGFPGVLISIAATLAGYQFMIAGLFALLALALISLVFYFLLQRGRVVLQSDRLIEYNYLNQPRVITYAQIFEVKRGTHADQTWIRYYPISRNGQINYRSIKGRNLIPVHRDAEMRHELSQRIRAPEPIRSQNMSPVLIVLVLGVLVIPIVITVFYLLVEAVNR